MQGVIDGIEDEMVKERRRKELAAHVRKAALSGVLSGAVGAGLHNFLGGERSISKVVAAAGKAGLFTGGLAGGATYVGGKAVHPDVNDPSGYTKSGGLGGLIGGGLAGAALGAGVGSGLVKFPKIAGITDNLLGDKIARAALSGGGKGAAVGAALGGTALGLGAGYRGMEEGMQLDFLHNQARKARARRQALEDYDAR